jgi:hypothetical protein
MSRLVKIVCDCGCGASITSLNHCGWFVLGQHQSSRGDGAKLMDDLEFSSLGCLKRWVEKASAALPELQKAAAELNPRGIIHDENVPGLCV